jgi:hypothetical protein
MVGSGSNELAGMCKEAVETTVVVLFRYLTEWTKVNGNASTRIIVVPFEI